MDNKKDNRNETESTGASLLSMLRSLAIVGFVLLFMAGFSHYLKTKTYHGPVREAEESTKEEDGKEELLEYDADFKPTYIIIKNVPEDGLYSNPLPGKKDAKSVSLKDGQIIKAMKHGSYDHKDYYQLDNNFYLEDTRLHIIPLKRYEERSGYVAITYISSNGVRLRRWPDFQAENNIEKYAFVGSKVDISGKIVTADDVPAYVTREGLYITTDSQYFKDYTHSLEESNKSEEDTTGIQDNADSKESTITEEDTEKESR